MAYKCISKNRYKKVVTYFTHLTIPNPSDTIMTSIRARVRLAQEANSAKMMRPGTLYPF